MKQPRERKTIASEKRPYFDLSSQYNAFMIRKVVIVMLSVAAVATLSIGLASYRAPVKPDWRLSRDGARNPTLPVNFSWDPGYKAYCGAHDNRLWVQHSTTRCLSCGMLPPNHAPGCWLRNVSVSYDFSHRDEKTLAAPGFKWESYIFMGSRYRVVHLSLWIPFVLFAAYPTIAWIRGPVRRWRRRQRSLCLTCGYDLTGNVSGVCPECGTPI